MNRLLLDTSVLIGAQHPGELEGVIEATFDPLCVDARVAREWGRLAAAVAERGGRPRRRAIDLAIAATANVHGVALLTAAAGDLAIIDDWVRVQGLDCTSRRRHQTRRRGQASGSRDRRPYATVT